MILSSVWVIDATCFDVFYSMWLLEDVSFSQSLSLLWDFFNRHIVVFVETSVLKKVCILRYLHNNSVYYTILYIHILEKLSYVAGFFYDNVFYTLYLFNCSTLFFVKPFFFFWKTQNISESMVLLNTVELF